MSSEVARETLSGGMRVAGLFAGIGGIELGLGNAGHKPSLLCEIDEFAKAILAERFPDSDLVTDVRSLDSLPEVELVTAGFPCQDLSQAGPRNGINGRQSKLVDEVFRLVEVSRHKPDWILLENVPFMLFLNRGAAMRHITDRLQTLGYDWAYRTVDSRAFGLPQRRRRVLILASGTKDPRSVLLAEDAGEPSFDASPHAPCGFYWTEGNRGLGWAVDAIPPLKGSSGLGIPSPPAIWSPQERAIVTPDIRDAERLQGFPADWTASGPSILQTQRGKQGRWRMVGNAVSVPLAEWIGRRIHHPDPYSSEEDRLLSPDSRWPPAAWGKNGEVHIADRSAWPITSELQSITEFLSFPTAPLSSRATMGFLKRLRASRLRAPEAFYNDLSHHAEQMLIASGKTA